ncbi:hypothetical protein [Gracilibacillus sp. Marseille-QA3620]
MALGNNRFTILGAMFFRTISIRLYHFFWIKLPVGLSTISLGMGALWEFYQNQQMENLEYIKGYYYYSII